MLLTQLFKDIEYELVGADTQITGLEYDSRKVKPGELFFCISGFIEDGHKYAESAVNKGASALMVSRRLDWLDVPQVVVPDDRKAMALCSSRFYGHPSKRMKIIGVTGTNGKTTTTYMIKKILENSGQKVGLIGTIKNMIGDEIIETERTTPESVDLHKLFKEMEQAGCDSVVMEVSSHSLVLNRVYGIQFSAGVFTNLTQDHLDFHKTWKNYISAKSILFSQSDISVINADDDKAADMELAAKGTVVKYGIDKSCGFRAQNLQLSVNGISYKLTDGNVVQQINVPIPGRFTVYNSMSAVVACSALGIEPQVSGEALRSMEAVPGRFEVLTGTGSPFSLILDYSHTPDSLENALVTIKNFAPSKIITVFGCGGNRDAAKRPLMGAIAGKYSDYVIVTSDNPRYEDPGLIIEQIVEGIDGENFMCIENRKNAISYAMDIAGENDIILLAGKGHETYQEISGIKHDFNEKKIVAELLGQRGLNP